MSAEQPVGTNVGATAEDAPVPLSPGVKFWRSSGGKPAWSIHISPTTTDEELGRMIRLAIDADRQLAAAAKHRPVATGARPMSPDRARFVWTSAV